jgi:uncharacterized protein with PQ loop repeat
LEFEVLLNAGTAIGFFSFIPQMYRTVKNRDTLKYISLLAQLLSMTAISCFVIFAFANAVWLTFVMDLVQVLYCLLTITLILRARRLERSAAAGGAHPDPSTPSTT